MWSVAVEWHIYFVFAFVLLPIWRSASVAAAAAAAFALGALPHFAFRGYDLDWAHPWYLSCFALGMLAAAVTEADPPAAAARVVRDGNTALLLSASVLLAVIYASKGRLGNQLFLVTDTLEGAIAALAIIRFEHQWRTGTRSPPRRLLESPAALGLGAMSYSLYLVHWPVLLVLDTLVGSHLRPEPRCWFLLVVGSPLAVLVALASYLAIERPLIAKRHAPPAVPTDGAAGPPRADASVLVQP